MKPSQTKNRQPKTRNPNSTIAYSNLSSFDLPEDWKVVPIQNIVEFQRGTEPGSKSYNDRGIGIRFLRVSDISGMRNEFIYTTASNVRICSPNDILISFDGSPGIVKRGFSGAYSSGIRRVNLRSDNTNLDFIFYVLQANFVQEIIRKYSSGITIKHASKSIPHIQIPLPPLSEQKKIAYVLSTVQEAKEKTENHIKALKEFKKSMMKHLFSYGPVSITDTDKTELKDTEIGKIPKHWEVVRLGDLSQDKKVEIHYGFPCGNWNDKGIGIPHIRPFNISEDGKTILNDLKYIQVSEDINKYKLKKGDVLFNNTNSTELVGKTAYWNLDKEYVISNHMTYIRIINYVINPIFLTNYLHKKWLDGFFIKICMKHVNQSSISRSKLENILIPLPPLPEQEQIASILSAIDERIEAEEKKKKALDEVFKSLLKDLMTARIRVKDINLGSK